MNAFIALVVIFALSASAPATYAQSVSKSVRSESRVTTEAAAHRYPTKPIRFIIPFLPGSTLDIMSRLIGPQFYAYAKSNRGKLSFGSNGDGGFPHMSMEMLRVASGLFDYTHIPYKGIAESPEWFAQVLKSDYEKYGKLIRAINFQPQ